MKASYPIQLKQAVSFDSNFVKLAISTSYIALFLAVFQCCTLKNGCNIETTGKGLEVGSPAYPMQW